MRMTGIVLAVWMTGAAVSAAAEEVNAAQPHRLLQVAVPDDHGARPVAPDTMRRWRNWLLERGYAVHRCGHDPTRGTMVIDSAQDADLLRLTDAGFTVLRSMPADREVAGRTQPQYFDPGEIDAMLSQVKMDHPNITKLISTGITTEGRRIWAVEISDNPGLDEDEPAIQFNGQHHAREVATSHVVMDIVETLTNGYGADPTITAWVNAYKTVCVPMVNPDGVQYVFDSDPWWRKNRQFYPPSCLGVDLNRNYPYLWGPGCGSSSSCSSSIYRGPSAASELETQALFGLADTYHFVMATSYHSFGRFIDYPYACSDGSPSGQMPEHDVIHEMMNGVADAIDAVDGVPRYTVYSPVPFGGVNGDDTSWYYAHQGTYPFIIEVGTSFEPAFSQVTGIVNRNRAGWQYMYDRLGQARIDVHVTDACTGLPLEAEVTLTDFVFDTGELARNTYPPFGRWTFVVVANTTYTVQASKPGYVTGQSAVFVGNLPEAVDIALEPAAPPIFADADCDGDVDLADAAAFVDCLTGPGGAAVPACDVFDAEPDADVDLDDFAAFQAVYTG